MFRGSEGLMRDAIGATLLVPRGVQAFSCKGVQAFSCKGVQALRGIM